MALYIFPIGPLRGSLLLHNGSGTDPVAGLGKHARAVGWDMPGMLVSSPPCRIYIYNVYIYIYIYTCPHFNTD